MPGGRHARARKCYGKRVGGGKARGMTHAPEACILVDDGAERRREVT